MKKNMIKEFVIQCLFFRSKESLHRLLGVFAWLNILNIIISASRIIQKLT